MAASEVGIEISP